MNLTPEKVADITTRLICLHSKQDVDAALDKMAKEITFALKDKNPLFLCVMNGAVIAMGQLMTRLHFPLQIDYIQASRYGGSFIDEGHERGGELKWKAKPTTSMKNRTVVLVEDVLDTGLTLAALKTYCSSEGAADVYTATLTDKAHPRSLGGVETCDFTGLRVADKFLLGYGMDWQEYFRNLPGIYVLADEDLP